MRLSVRHTSPIARRWSTNLCERSVNARRGYVEQASIEEGGKVSGGLLALMSDANVRGVEQGDESGLAQIKLMLNLSYCFVRYLVLIPQTQSSPAFNS